jgi:hypothetical protein
MGCLKLTYYDEAPRLRTLPLNNPVSFIDPFGLEAKDPNMCPEVVVTAELLNRWQIFWRRFNRAVFGDGSDSVDFDEVYMDHLIADMLMYAQQKGGYNSGTDINPPSYNEAQGGVTTNVGNWVSNWWNTHWTAKSVPDVIYINVGAVYNFVGGGAVQTGYVLPIRGKNAFHLYSTVTLVFKGGLHGNVGINIGYSTYSGGDARNFDFENTFGGKGTRGYDWDIIFGFGSTYSQPDASGGRLYSLDFGVGLSVGASINVGSVTYVNRIW